jgi:hypothetical protein
MADSCLASSNILLSVYYQLNFSVFMYVTRILRNRLRSALSAVSRNRGRSWNVLPWIRGYYHIVKCDKMSRLILLAFQNTTYSYVKFP